MTNTLQELSAGPEPKRDRYGRPLVPLRNGDGALVAYTRPTTIADTLDDRHNLELWMQRQVLKGSIARPDLHALAATTDPDDKAALNKLCSQLRDAAASDAGANMGTAVHAAVELFNRNGTVLEHFRSDVEAYGAALAAAGATVDAEHVEQFVVNDDVGAAGTFDMRLQVAGEWYVADLKTGSTVEWSARAFAVQLAIYATATSYFSWATMEHDDPQPVSNERGVIVHLPAGSGECTLHWIDLAAGLEALDHALWVRSWRKRKGVLTPFKIEPGGTDTSAAVTVVGPVERPTNRRPARIKQLPEDQRPAPRTSGAAPEGDACTQDDIDILKAALSELGEAKDHVTRWKDQASRAVAGNPPPDWGIRVAEQRTQRRYELAMAACALASFAHDDDEATTDDIARRVIALALGDEHMVQTHDVGRLIGVLTVDEARKVRKFTEGASLSFDQDDRPVIRAA